MSGSRVRSWLVAGLLAVPLLLVAAWLTSGGMRRAFGPGASAASTTRSPGGMVVAANPLPGFPDPVADLGPERFHERVDGAAEVLRTDGCERLVVWRFRDPGAEVSLLVFRDAAGAARELARDAGTDRTPGPGDEAWAGASAVFFRRGRRYVRVLADSVAPPAGTVLRDLARKVDDALRAAGDSRA